MDVVLIGPGRAGMALALALTRAGHRVVAVGGHGDVSKSAERLGSDVLEPDAALPPADLLVLAVGDGVIAQVARDLAPRATDVGGVVHLSGAVPVAVLEPFAMRGMATGAFHPLQTLPDPDRGAAALAGSAAGITASDPVLHEMLRRVAADIGMTAFDLGDGHRPLYHAAASMASNALVATLWLAERLFDAAGVDPGLARPLAEAAVFNSYEGGPAAALTGPVARGDMTTVEAQIEAVRTAEPEVLGEFLAALRLIAGAAGRREESADVVP